MNVRMNTRAGRSAAAGDLRIGGRALGKDDQPQDE
jgi:hypothetical protein